MAHKVISLALVVAQVLSINVKHLNKDDSAKVWHNMPDDSFL
jgi:hypothetical protein